jgi:hypothetical protein
MKSESSETLFEDRDGARHSPKDIAEWLDHEGDRSGIARGELCHDAADVVRAMDAKLRDRAAEIERLTRELKRHRHGNTIEGDSVCAHELQAAAVQRAHERTSAMLEHERAVHSADVARMEVEIERLRAIETKARDYAKHDGGCSNPDVPLTCLQSLPAAEWCPWCTFATALGVSE